MYHYKSTGRNVREKLEPIQDLSTLIIEVLNLGNICRANLEPETLGKYYGEAPDSFPSSEHFSRAASSSSDGYRSGLERKLKDISRVYVSNFLNSIFSTLIEVFDYSSILYFSLLGQTGYFSL